MQQGFSFFSWLSKQISTESGRDDVVSDFAHEVSRKGNRGYFKRLKSRDDWWRETNAKWRGALDVAWRAFQGEKPGPLEIQPRRCLGCDAECSYAINGTRFGHSFNRYTDNRTIGLVLLSPFDNKIRYACSRVAEYVKRDLKKGDYSLVMHRLQENAENYGAITALTQTVIGRVERPTEMDWMTDDINFFLDYPSMPARVRLPYPGEFGPVAVNIYVLVDRYTHEGHRVKKILFSSPLPLAHTWFPVSVETPSDEAIELVFHLCELLSDQLASR